MTKNRVVLRGSFRNLPIGVRATPLVNHNIRSEITVYLQRKAPLPTSYWSVRLDRDTLVEKHGADLRDITRVRRFAADYNLDVVDVDVARRAIVLSGWIGDLSQAFGVELQHFQYSKGSYIGRSGPITVPANIVGSVLAVFGLDGRPQAKPHFRVQRTAFAPENQCQRRAYSPLEIAELYQFPQSTGIGECIALIELGGGYQRTDLNAYFANLGLSTPEVTAFSVDRAYNSPLGARNSADGEVALAIEIAGAIAPQAKIAVYFAPNTSRGFVDAITTAVHDTVSNPSLLSIGWGGPERSFTAQARRVINDAFQDAAALGISVFVAAGDDGSTDRIHDGELHVDFPASSPFTVGCGGTRLTAQGTSSASEVVWNSGISLGATGGGFSEVFAQPPFQKQVNVPGTHRGVPDVAGNADPDTGYSVRLHACDAVLGGTSAVAPLYAGLLARINHLRQRSSQLGRAGFLNPVLYGAAMVRNGYRGISEGNNNVTPAGGAYHAGVGWNACTGLGSVKGNVLANILTGQDEPAASLPQPDESLPHPPEPPPHPPHPVPHRPTPTPPPHVPPHHGPPPHTPTPTPTPTPPPHALPHPNPHVPQPPPHPRGMLASEARAQGKRVDRVEEDLEPEPEAIPIVLESRPETQIIAGEWLAWTAENRLLGTSDEQIKATLVEAGFDQTVASIEMERLHADPVFQLAARTAQQLNKLKSLLGIHHSLRNLAYGADMVERRGRISEAEFVERYYSANRPVIMTGLLEGSVALNRWTPQYLAEMCGDATIQIMADRESDPEYEINSNAHRREVPMSEYVSMVIRGGQSNDYYLVANNGFFDRPETQRLYEQIPLLPEYLNHEKSTKKIFLWFGPAGTVTPLHHDVMNILVAQICGRKRFSLIAPDQTPYVYNERSVFAEVDCDHPDYSRFPLYRRVKRLSVELEAGDVLFIPVGWWHQVKTLDIAIMLSYINFKAPNEYEWF